jgi:hypothetical protein
MRKLWIAAVLAAVACISLEAALRVVGYSSPRWYQLDTQLGWSLQRHKKGWYFSEGARIPVLINAAGFRDKEQLLDKPEGVYRIAVLGDDYSEALNVQIQRTWWWQLPRALDACTRGKQIEVLNFAVGGYGTAQELVMLESTAMRYQPDLVLVQFSSRDDVVDNSFALTPHKERPFYFLDAKGVARIDESFTSSPGFDRHMQTRYRLGAEIADHSRAFQLARQIAGAALIGEAHAEPDPAAMRPPREAVWEDAWRITEALLARMNRYSRANGARLVLVNVPHPQQAGESMAYPDQRLAALAKREHVPFVSLTSELQAAHYLPSGQWSVEAHRAAALAVARSICPLL